MTFRSLIAAMFIFAVALGTTAQAQEKAPMLVGGQLELGLPMGEYSDMVGLGFGVAGNFHYGIQPRLWLIGSLGYERFPYESEVFLNREGSDAAFFVQAGARYEMSEGDEIVPYVGAKIGLHFWATKVTATNFGGMTLDDRSGAAIGLSPMFGVTYPITTSISLDAALKYTILVRDTKDNGDATFFSLQAGVLIPLNL
jgi:opacity protein-like surface antigen